MLILGITGPIGHGKSTLAKAFMAIDKSAVRIESSTLIAEVANKWLKNFPKELLVDDHDYDILEAWTTELSIIASEALQIKIHPEQLLITEKTFNEAPETVARLVRYISLIEQGVVEINSEINDGNKDKNRAILQWLGGFLIVRVSEGVWYDEIERQILDAETKGKSLCLVGGIRYPYDAEVIRRNGGKLAKLIRKDLPPRDSSDITEAHWAKLKVDTAIKSTASKEALGEMARAVYEDLLADNLLPEYNSGDFQGVI